VCSETPGSKDHNGFTATVRTRTHSYACVCVYVFVWQQQGTRIADCGCPAAT
jgi:hypothetical protein